MPSPRSLLALLFTLVLVSPAWARPPAAPAKDLKKARSPVPTAAASVPTLKERLALYFPSLGPPSKEVLALLQPVKEADGLGIILGASPLAFAYVVDDCDHTAGEPCTFRLEVLHRSAARIETLLAWREDAPPTPKEEVKALRLLARLKLDPGARWTQETVSFTPEISSGYGPPILVGPLAGSGGARFVRIGCVRRHPPVDAYLAGWIRLGVGKKGPLKTTHIPCGYDLWPDPTALRDATGHRILLLHISDGTSNLTTLELP